MEKFIKPLIEVIKINNDEIITTSGERPADPADFGPGDNPVSPNPFF